MHNPYRLVILCMVSVVLLTAFQYPRASQITNQITGLGIGTGKQDVYLCYNSVNDPYNFPTDNLLPHQSFNLPLSYFSNFNVRLNGCNPSSDTYIGNLTISNDGPVAIKNPSYSNLTNIQNLQVKDGILSGQTEYITPTPVKLAIPTHKISKQSPWDYVGVNLSGNEFGKLWSPINSPHADEMLPFINAGMNTFRLPIRWAYLEPEGAGIGKLDDNYLRYITAFLENATQYNINVIVDLHNYMRYAPAGITIAGVPAGSSIPDGNLVTQQQLVTVWTKLATAIKANKKIDSSYLIFDLSNEPTEMSSIGGTEAALQYQNAVIKALRDLALNNLVLIEGNHWTGLHSWSKAGDDGTSANSGVFTAKAIQDPVNNYAINVHQYFDSDFSGTHDDCIAVPKTIKVKQFVNYLKANHLKAFVSEFGTGRANNCSADLTWFLSQLKENAYTKEKDYGFIGWTAWSAGHAWGDYPGYLLLIDSTAPQMEVFKRFLN